jgi:hypothetical protein
MLMLLDVQVELDDVQVQLEDDFLLSPVDVVPLFVSVHVDQPTVANHITDHIHPWIAAGRRLPVLGARVTHAPLLHHCLRVLLSRNG